MDNHQDPHADREARKYENPIPSREFITQHLSTSKRPLNFEQISFELAIFDLDQAEALRRRLRAMVRDGQLNKGRKGVFTVAETEDLIVGTVIGHRDGFGFVQPLAGGKDLFLNKRQMRRVFDGDRVAVRIVGTDFKGRPEGTIVSVEAHNTQQLVGRFFQRQGIDFVRPDNRRIQQDIIVAPNQIMAAEAGQYVVIELIRQPDKYNDAVGKVIEVLGEHMAPGMEIEVAIQNHDIPNIWSAEVIAQAEALETDVLEADKQQRLDLRDLPFITIDGEDARDFDDAVYCQPRSEGGWLLYVAIADVSHYVPINSPLDIEAQARATSVYFPERVIPMLPEAISNGLCSLNPQVDRLVMVCEMTISDEGALQGHCFYEGVIHSHARTTYTQVGSILDSQDEHHAQNTQTFAAVVPAIHQLYALYVALRYQRTVRGAIDFDTQETRIIFGAERKIEQIVPVVRNDAHKLIEECMLCANVSAAAFLQAHDLHGIYRVHKGPKQTKLDNLRAYLGELGLNLAGGEAPQPKDYQQLLQTIADRPEASIVQSLLLRSLGQAVYTPENEGHFGLGYDAYAHFTSPIRRYPDLLVHRAIRSIIQSPHKSTAVKRIVQTNQKPTAPWYPYSAQQMAELGEHCSMAERRADEAVWDVEGWLKCVYMQSKIGDECAGTITSVTNFGLFVQLDEYYVDGLVHITSLPKDYYQFEQERFRLIGERSRLCFGLGEKVQVKVARVDLEDQKIDLDLISGGHRPSKRS